MSKRETGLSADSPLFDNFSLQISDLHHSAHSRCTTHRHGRLLLGLVAEHTLCGQEHAGNAGEEGAVVVQKVREGKGDFGYNARLDKYEDLREAGVIDPAKVARVALENAASIAGMFLTTECLICDKPEKEPAMPMGGAPGMGGMM